MGEKKTPHREQHRLLCGSPEIGPTRSREIPRDKLLESLVKGSCVGILLGKKQCKIASAGPKKQMISVELKRGRRAISLHIVYEL